MMGFILVFLGGLYAWVFWIAHTEPRNYHEYQMNDLSKLRPKICPNCGGGQDNFFVGTDGLTCLRCTYNFRPKVAVFKPPTKKSGVSGSK